MPNQDYFKDKLVTLLSKNGIVTLKDIAEVSILPKNRELEFIFLMYYEGVVLIDIDDNPINRNTGISIWHQKK